MRLFVCISQWKPGFNSKSIHVGFLVDKLVFCKVFLANTLAFPLSIVSPASIISPDNFISSI